MRNPFNNKMEKMMLAIGKTLIDIDTPLDCPRPDVFRQVVARLIEQHFGDAELAGEARRHWQECQTVPEPFASNLIAAGYYRSALLALNPMAQRWIAFEEAVNREFADHEDDGDRKEPAIPGWSPGWITIA